MKAFLAVLFTSLALTACSSLPSTSGQRVISSKVTHQKVCDLNGRNCRESYQEVIVTAQPITTTNERNLQPPVTTFITFETYNRPPPVFYGPVYSSGCCYAPRPDGKWWRMRLP